MTPLTDDELGSLLTKTFTAHEHLADPDRAVAFAASPAPTRHPGRSLLVAAAAVALVVGGTSYLLVRGSDPGGPTSRPTTPAGSSFPPTGPRQLTTDSANRAAAERLVGDALASLPTEPGLRSVDLVPELRSTSAAIVRIPDFTASRVSYWTGGGSADATAAWYAAHAPTGFRVQGGPGTVDSEGGVGTPLIRDVYLVQPRHDRNPPPGVQIVIQTVQRADGGVGVRATASAVWRPARPAESYVDHVTSIDVHERIRDVRRQPRTVHRDWTIRSPAQVLAVVATFNRLPGWPPNVHGCFPTEADRTYRLVFHTASGDVTVTGTIGCYDDLTVHRDGHRVGPHLDHGSRLAVVLAGSTGAE